MKAPCERISHGSPPPPARHRRQGMVDNIAPAPGSEEPWGGIAVDNRRFVNAVLWIMRTGAPWRDLPPSCGASGGVPRRLRACRQGLRLEGLLGGGQGLRGRARRPA